jgi:diphosphomevalonate decarboxylase
MVNSFYRGKTMTIASAIAYPNIAFIKYWGNRDDALRLPANGSISMNLAGLETRTTVEFDPQRAEDEFTLQGALQEGAPVRRVSDHLNLLRNKAGLAWKARVASVNNFPIGAGIASSASAFAALTAAAAAALGLKLSERELSILARRGSGSACRSVPEGFVEWASSNRDEESFARSFAAPDYWALTDLIAILDDNPKKVGSAEGNRLALTSPLQSARVADTPRRLDLCRRAILARDFPALAYIIEEDTRLMHAVMLTSSPALLYLEPDTLRLMRLIPQWRNQGLPVAYTIDAGPNVHCLCPQDAAAEVERRLREISGVRNILHARPGAGAKVVPVQAGD